MPKLGFHLFWHFRDHFCSPGGHPTFERAVSSYTKNDLAPSSDRPERAVDTWYHRGMAIIHHIIDSGGPGGDPGAPGPNVQLNVIFSHTSTNFPNSRNAFREAAHVRKMTL